MAVVYRAFDPVVERSLAVKVLRFRPRRRKKIVREARLRANLNLYVPFGIFETEARSILSPVSGFLLEAGFTHSLTPARNCTFGCSYCYVPTMRVQAGLRAEDWTHWGGHTTFKRNAAELLRKSLRPRQAIYCSPLTDPYQPAEADRRLMPGVLEAIAANPPAVFVIQTRGPLILRDIELLPDLRAVLCLDRRALANRRGAACGPHRCIRHAGAHPALLSGGADGARAGSFGGSGGSGSIARPRCEKVRCDHARCGARDLPASRLDRVGRPRLPAIHPRSHAGCGASRRARIRTRPERLRAPRQSAILKSCPWI
jgi:hypothetical protein